MNELLRMLRELPLSVKILLLIALARSVSFFALLPFLPIYLHDTLDPDMVRVGYTLGLCLFVGTLTSVYGGYLADRFNKVSFMLALDVILTAIYLTLPVVHTLGPVLLLLMLANTASSSMSVTGNALLAELLPTELRTKVFSLRYSLQNIGAVTGPFLGAWCARWDMRGPFWLAGTVTAFALVLLGSTRRHFAVAPPGASKAEPDKPLRFSETLRVMRADRRLGLFTLGGILSMVIYGPLLTYLSQYLVVVAKNSDLAYKTVSYFSAANAFVVISLQYFVGSRLKPDNLLRWLTWGIAAFVVGLVGLSLWLSVAVALVPCIIAICIFTIGEVIVVPAEYTFIDSIAPSHLRGSYFGVQNLIYFGVALGPIMCGVLLDKATPVIMFYALIAVAITSWLFYVLGCRTVAAPSQGPAAAAGTAGAAAPD
ncbi:MAG TPA: MFS transporter [Kofleriaceae bacterium]|jgi:MFS family permease|nr:MFS transporter [Kofleriaceae bacterium]